MSKELNIEDAKDEFRYIISNYMLPLFDSFEKIKIFENKSSIINETYVVSYTAKKVKKHISVFSLQKSNTAFRPFITKLKLAQIK